MAEEGPPGKWKIAGPDTALTTWIGDGEASMEATVMSGRLEMDIDGEKVVYEKIG